MHEVALTVKMEYGIETKIIN